MLDFGFYLMDCMEGMKQFPDKYFDLAIVDPPYRDENCPFPEMRGLMSKNLDKKNLFSSGKPDDAYFEELERVSKAQIIWGANNFGRPFMGFIAWDKCVRGFDRYSQVEIASLSESLSKSSTLVQITTYTGNKIHPSEKPINLYEWIIGRYAKPGDIILDTHVGSASSLIACHNTGHKFVGFEIDSDYYERAKKRYETETAQIRLTDIIGGI